MEKIDYIKLAMEQANQSLNQNDEPYGAIITTKEGVIIASCGNSENTDNDPTSHAEINAIRLACKNLKSKSLKGCRIYTNYKPCPMCMSAILMTGIDEIYIGSSFDGVKMLYTNVIEKVNNSSLVIESSLNEDECKKQVYDGRKKLVENNKDYHSGHKNGVI